MYDLANHGVIAKMSGVDTRNIERDSLFLMADLNIEGISGTHRVKVRNLSAGGMMAEGGPDVTRGAKLAVELRNIGWVDGVVAWVQDGRFGIAFATEIEPKLARAPVGTKSEMASPRFTRTPSRYGHGSDPSRVRTI